MDFTPVVRKEAAIAAVCDCSSPHRLWEEWTGELDRDLRPAGAEATETASCGDLVGDSEVIALMLEAAPVGELRMLLTGSIGVSTTSPSLAWKMGLVKVPMFFVSWEVTVANVLSEPASSKPEPESFTSRGANCAFKIFTVVLRLEASHWTCAAGIFGPFFHRQ